MDNLNKLTKLLGADRIMTADDVQQILLGIMEILKTYKQGTESINEDTKTVVNSLLEKIVQSNKETIDKAETVLDSRMGDLETLLKDVKQMINDVEVLASNVKDGKDADEEKIVEDVISKIKIDPTVVTVSAQEIRDKLASLKDEERLDKSSIKGLEKILFQKDLDYAIATLQQQTSFLINKGGLKNVTAGTNVTIDYTDPSNPVISSSGGGGSGSPGGSTTQLQYNNAGNFGGISGATTDGTAVTYTTGNLKAADVTASGSGGFLIQASNGTDVGLFGAGNGSNATFYGGVNITGDLTVDTNVLDVDTTNDRIGILTTAPTHSLTFGSTSTGIALYNTVDQTTNYERALMQWSGNVFTISTGLGGTGGSRGITISTVGGGSMAIAGSTGLFTFSKSASSGVNLFTFSGTQSGSTGTVAITNIAPTINQSSTAGYTALLINPTETTTGSGTKLLADFQVGGTSKTSIKNTGEIATTFTGTQMSFQSNGTLFSHTNGNSFWKANFTGKTWQFQNSSSTVVQTMLHDSGYQAIGMTGSPTAILHLGAGTATASTAPLKFTSGTNLTTPENGAIEYNGTNFYATPSGAVRQTISLFYNNAQTATANAVTVPITYKVATVTNNSAAALTITLTTSGAVDGQLLLVRVLDFSAVAQTLTFVNTENSDVSVPATTNGSTTLPRTVGFMYNTLTSKWRCISNV